MRYGTRGMGAASAATGSAFMGLWERITIGIFVLWMLVVALRLCTPPEVESVE